MASVNEEEQVEELIKQLLLLSVSVPADKLRQLPVFALKLLHSSEEEKKKIAQDAAKLLHSSEEEKKKIAQDAAKKIELAEQKAELAEQEKRDQSIVLKGLPEMRLHRHPTSAPGRKQHRPAYLLEMEFRLLENLPEGKIMSSHVWKDAMELGYLSAHTEDQVQRFVHNAIRDWLDAHCPGMKVAIIDKPRQGHFFPDGTVVKYVVIMEKLNFETPIGSVEIKPPNAPVAETSAAAATEDEGGARGGEGSDEEAIGRKQPPRRARENREKIESPAPVTSNSNPLEDIRVYGQLFDYLRDLMIVHGVLFPIGILSTYHGWRICWLEEADDLASVESLVEKTVDRHKKVDRQNLINNMKQEVKIKEKKLALEEVERLENVIRSATTKEKQSLYPELRAAQLWAQSTGSPDHVHRLLLGTRIIPYNDLHLFKYVLSAILKMKSSPVTQWSNKTEMVPNPETTFHELSESGTWSEKKLDQGLTFPYVEEGLPHPNCTNFVFLKNLGIGGDAARVWMVCAGGDKTVAALKFLQVANEEAAVDLEVVRWTSIYGPRVARKRQFAEHYAVLMPFLYAFPKEARRGAEVAVKACLKAWVQSGWRHNDLRWRHVFYGTQKPPLTERVFLIDLSRVDQSVPPPSDQVETIVNTIWDSLLAAVEDDDLVVPWP